MSVRFRERKHTQQRSERDRTVYHYPGNGLDLMLHSGKRTALSKRLVKAMREEVVHHNKGATDKIAKDAAKRGPVLSLVALSMHFKKVAEKMRRTAVSAAKHMNDYEKIPVAERKEKQGEGVFAMMREGMEKPAIIAQDVSEVLFDLALFQCFAGNSAEASDEVCTIIGERMKTGDFKTPLKDDFADRRIVMKVIPLSKADEVIEERRNARVESIASISPRGGKKKSGANNATFRARMKAVLDARDPTAPKNTQQCKWLNDCRSLRAGSCEWKHTEAEKKAAKKTAKAE